MLWLLACGLREQPSAVPIFMWWDLVLPLA